MAPCFHAEGNLNLQQRSIVKVEDTKPWMVPCFHVKDNLDLQQGCIIKVEDTKPWMASLAYFKLNNSSNLNVAMDINFMKELEIMFHFVQNLEKSSTIDSTYALLRTFDLILTKYLQATLYVWCKQLVIPINKHNQKKLKSCTTINFTKPLKQHTTILHQLTMFHHYGQRKDTWNCHFLAQHKREHT
jgi:hypothetical protein